MLKIWSLLVCLSVLVAFKKTKVDISCIITGDSGPYCSNFITCIRIYNAKKKNHDHAKYWFKNHYLKFIATLCPTAGLNAVYSERKSTKRRKVASLGLFKTTMPIFFGKILQCLQYDVISPLTDDILFSGIRFMHNKHESWLRINQLPAFTKKMPLGMFLTFVFQILALSMGLFLIMSNFPLKHLLLNAV